MARKTAVFVDGVNFYYMCTSVAGHKTVRYENVLRHLAALTNADLQRAIYYTAESTDNDRIAAGPYERLISALSHAGFQIRRKRIKKVGGKGKANHDVEIATDMMRLVMTEGLEQVILVSGDGDFTYLLQEVRRMGVRTVVAALGNSLQPAEERRTARELLSATDQFLDLRPLIHQWASILQYSSTR